MMAKKTKNRKKVAASKKTTKKSAAKKSAKTIAAKRAHDRDLPIWILIIFFGGGALLDLLTVLELTGSDDQPSVLSLVIAVPFTVLLVALLIELGFRRGTIGPNQYGPDPVASH